MQAAPIFACTLKEATAITFLFFFVLFSFSFSFFFPIFRCFCCYSLYVYVCKMYLCFCVPFIILFICSPYLPFYGSFRYSFLCYFSIKTHYFCLSVSFLPVLFLSFLSSFLSLVATRLLDKFFDDCFWSQFASAIPIPKRIQRNYFFDFFSTWRRN